MKGCPAEFLHPSGAKDLRDICRAKPGDYRPGTQRVYRTAAAPSAISLRVLPQRP